MKVFVAKNDLVSLIGKIQGVVAQRPALPALSNVLVETGPDHLVLSATDLSMSLRAYIPAKIVEEGSITLPARRFFQLVRELTMPQIEIRTETADTALLIAGSSEFKIHGMSKKEFPTFPEVFEGIPIKISAALLKEMLSRSAFAAAKEDSRHILNGVQISTSDSNRLSFIGTDGKRLAKLTTFVELPAHTPTSLVVPLRAVEEMIKLLDAEQEMTTLTLHPEKISLEVGSVQFVSQIILGQYPDVDRVIPEKQPDPVSLHREELMTLLRQVALFTSDQSSSVRFTFSSGALNLAAMSGDIGEGKVNMPVNYQGEDLHIAFNPTFFLDILRHSKDEVVSFNVSSAYNPGLITDSSEATFVIMPMRLDN